MRLTENDGGRAHRAVVFVRVAARRIEERTVLSTLPSGFQYMIKDVFSYIQGKQGSDEAFFS